MPVRYEDEAREALLEAVRWYEGHRATLGRRFHEKVKAAERFVALSPTAYPPIARVGNASIRRVLVEDFPYGLLFMEHAGELRILAVMHLHRRPGYWRQRARRLVP
jgi:hypothetical protein